MRDDDHNLFATTRRQALAAGGAALSTMLTWPMTAAADTPALRWGIVGTGSIAGSMAQVMASVPLATARAVSSRRMSSAEGFAATWSIDRAFDSWNDMFAWDGIDAVYVATPTGVREEISIAAANHGKHVLAEKPFASAASVQRIVDACRQNGVGFMDGTHFGHHPRTQAIRAALGEQVGWPWSLTSTFQFPLPDKSNIRYNLDLEPMGSVGDVGWYCMRAIAEYLPRDLTIDDLKSFVRRDPETRAAVSGCGVIRFSDGATSSWNCGFESGAVFTDLRLTGAKGVITLDDFPSNEADGSANYLKHIGGFGTTAVSEVHVPSDYSSRQLMFQDFAAMIGNEAAQSRSIADSLRTQELLDAVWAAGSE